MATFQNKYKPKNIDEIVFADNCTKNKISQLAKNGSSKIILLHGENGVGKSIIADIISAVYFHSIPASDFYQITAFPDPLYEHQVKSSDIYTNGKSLKLKNYRCIVIDRLHYYSTKQQEELLNSADCSHDNILCICTTNNLKRVDVRIRAICELVEIPTPQPERWLDRVKYIIEQEGFKVPDKSDLIKLIKLGDANGRHILHEVEDYLTR